MTVELSDISKIKDNVKNLILTMDCYSFEFEKSIAIINCILDRAEKTIRGEILKGRWPFVDNSYTSPEKMIDQAMEILRKIQNGVIPFEGKFTEPGGTIIDHALIKKDGLYHLFYIRGKACTTWAEAPTVNFGHSISEDFCKWNIAEPILQALNGTWEEYQVWAPHIIYHRNEYWMFYTGVNYNVAQAIGVARSRDLYNWERYERNPIVKPGNWGYWDVNYWSDCRDPMVLPDGDKFYLYYTASLKEKSNGRNVYCIGIASSKDLLSWTDEGYAMLSESTETPPESPFVVKRDGKYYLFYTDYKAGTVYAVSEDPVKGWKDAPKDKRIVIQQNPVKGWKYSSKDRRDVNPQVAASEVYEEDGKWYITFISHFDNQLSFFEIKELIWNADGSFSTDDIEASDRRRKPDKI